MSNTTMKVIDEIRYDEKTDEYSLIFKGYKAFNEFCNRIQYLNYLIDHYAKKAGEKI